MPIGARSLIIKNTTANGRKIPGFSDTIKLLKIRGEAMQNAVPNGEGGMLAVLGSKIEIIEDLLSENKNNFIAQIANDNSEGQIVLSGKNRDIEKLIGLPLIFAADCIGTTAELAVTSQKTGGVVLLENTRFHEGEEKNSIAFAKSLAKLADIYCNDAFSCAHRAHASTEAIAHLLPTCSGKLMEEELQSLETTLTKPERPLTAIVGGSKVSTKLDLLKNLIQKVDTLIVGGGMANTFLLAKGFSIGASLAEHKMKNNACMILDTAQKVGCKILLPSDVVVAKQLNSDVENFVVPVTDCPSDLMILDVGPKTLENAKGILVNSKTVIWNGPLGAFEIKPFDQATNILANFVSNLSYNEKLISIAGGGDTLAALNNAEASDGFSYLSTAGGAFLEWMEGKKLPGIAALE